MRLAIIKDGLVENVVVADLEFANNQGWNYIQLEQDQPCAIGWTYDGQNFISPIIIEEVIPNE